MRQRVCLGFVAFLLGTLPRPVAAVCVNPGGTGGCFASIQNAIDTAPNGDVVQIAAGTYVGSVVVGPGRSLTLAGAGATNTVLQGTAPIIQIRGMKTTVTLRGLGIEGTAFDNHLVEAVNEPVSMVVEDCILTGTDAVNGTAALSNPAVVRRTLVKGAQTGIVVGKGGTIEDTVVRGNGFGIEIFGGDRGPVRIRRTEISDGTASGIVIWGGRYHAFVTDSTISGNASPAIYVVDRTSLTVQRSTLANNGTTQPSCCGTPTVPTAGGIWISDDHVTVAVRATILANAGSDCAVRDPALPAHFRSAGFNVVQSGPCGKARRTDAVDRAALLMPLADNGGTSRTHALLAGSPALDRVSVRSICKERDQRGAARALPCDSGAFEAP